MIENEFKVILNKNQYDILWITEFPMFEWSEE